MASPVDARVSSWAATKSQHQSHLHGEQEPDECRNRRKIGHAHQVAANRNHATLGQILVLRTRYDWFATKIDKKSQAAKMRPGQKALAKSPTRWGDYQGPRT
jgi:hypothetical protein